MTDPEIKDLDDLIEVLKYKPYFVDQDNKFFVKAILFLTEKIQSLQEHLDLLSNYVYECED